MRICLVRRPTTATIDGIRLDSFEPGRSYELGTVLGTLFLAEGWAVPSESEEDVVTGAAEDSAARSSGLTQAYIPRH